jgi:hypothetical protein
LDIPVGEVALAADPNGLVSVPAVEVPLAPAFNAPNPLKLPPKPVCWFFSVPNSEAPNDELAPDLVPGPTVLAPDVPDMGLVAPDELGRGGNDSTNAAPNDEVGLKGFRPANPVI